MSQEHDPDRESTEPSGASDPQPAPASPQAHPQWAPPAAAVDAPRPHANVGPVGGPEPTAPLPTSLAPSLMPPAPPPPPQPSAAGAPRHAADLAVRRPGSSGPAGWAWPLVALLALVVGLAGGLLGAFGYDRLLDDGVSGPGYADGGLADVDLEELPPLEEPGSVAAVAQAVLPSTVQIIAEYDGQEAGASGSGWVMDNNGHIVTNNHVVADAAKNDGPIIVVDHARNRHEATVVGRSPVYDLAVLFVKDHDSLKPAALGHARRLRVGEPVVAVGSPLNLPDTVTSGIVSYLNRPVTTGTPTPDQSSYINAIQTDAAINPGNSGGPLVNMQGQVIGVNSAIATAGGGGSIDQDAGNIGVGFAIPVEQVRVTADQILRTGEARYPIIGAKVQTGGLPTGDGATLDEISARSPAEKAGLKAGDRITHVNGARVADGIALIVAIRSYQPGQTIQFTVERGGEQRKVQVTLDGQVG